MCVNLSEIYKKIKEQFTGSPTWTIYFNTRKEYSRNIFATGENIPFDDEKYTLAFVVACFIFGFKNDNREPRGKDTMDKLVDVVKEWQKKWPNVQL